MTKFSIPSVLTTVYSALIVLLCQAYDYELTAIPTQGNLRLVPLSFPAPQQ